EQAELHGGATPRVRGGRCAPDGHRRVPPGRGTTRHASAAWRVVITAKYLASAPARERSPASAGSAADRRGLGDQGVGADGGLDERGEVGPGPQVVAAVDV